MSLVGGLQRAVGGALRVVGTDVIVSRRVVGTFDRTTQVPANTMIDYRVTGAWEEIRNSEVNGTSIKAGDRRLTIAGGVLPFTPTTQDRITDVFGARYRVTKVTRHEIADGTAAYTFMVRGNA